MKLSKTILGICLLFFCNAVLGQDKSNRGREFWLGYGFDYSFFHEPPVNSQELALYISTEQAATVTVSINGTAWTQTLNIPANTVDATILIPKSGPNDARILTDGLSARGIHIESNVPVAVYAHVYATMVSGATMLMPVETYGYVYHSINYRQTTSGSNLPSISPTTQNGQDWYSWFYVVAPENNTRVEIIPSDTTKNGWLPGQTYTVNLNKGEIYSVFGKLVAGNNAAWAASKDMTGSKVTAVVGADGNCHPIAVFSGSGGIRICRGDGGEYMQQQVFPAQAWGTRYLTYHTINNTNTEILPTNRNYYRVCVTDPTTVVRRNGAVLTGLTGNFFYEFQDSTGGDYIEADKPILLSQYTVNKNQCWNFPTTTPAPVSYGDPEMFYLSPIEQGQKSVLFYTSRKSGIDYVYANIHLPTAAVGSLRVDGNPLPATQIIPHPNYPAYSVALARFIGPAAQHTITADSAFNATVYGLGNYESYGYNVGTKINNLNYYGAIKNTFNTTGSYDTSTCPTTPVRLFFKTGYPLVNIHWKLGQVSGMTPNTDSIIANPIPFATETINGRTYYVYTLQQDFRFAAPGTYNIPVDYTSSVIANCNQTENGLFTVKVNPGPRADFSIANLNCLADTVRFTGTSNTAGFSINAYLWNFDDASTQNTLNAQKLFAAAGTQNVRYRIFATNGCVGDTTKTITINPAPVARLGITPTICQRDSARVTDTSTISAGTIASRLYLFGDGNSLTLNGAFAPFFYRYANPGTYTVKMVATANNGCKSDTSYQTVTVNPSPLARFGYSGNICAGDSILLTDSSSIASGSIASWQWNFGDGNTLVRNNNAPFYHPYNTASFYTVGLVTVSNLGCISDTARRTVTVVNRPVVTHTVGFIPCVDSPYTYRSSIAFNNLNPATYYWILGDGTTRISNTADTVIHRYSMPMSNFVTKHWVSYGPGCTSDTSYLTVPVVNPNPVAVFTFSSDSFCVDRPVVFNGPANDISEWRWSWGDGFQLSSTPPPISHTYLVPGTSSVSLVIRSTAGCISAPFSLPVTVYARPRVDAGPDLYISPGAAVTINATVTGQGNFSLLWSPPTDLSSTTVPAPIATPNNTVTYTLTARETSSGCAASDEVTIFTVSKLFIPNAFTPNGDGKNDWWRIPGMALYPNGLVTVYNRYGQKVYEAKAYHNNPWNGFFNGEAVPNGGYVYMIQLNNDQKEVIKGTILVIR
jgi:gliding motility-associated-like protein